MDLSRVIIGQVVTEKSERMKQGHRTYTVKVDPRATKIDVQNALKKHFDIDVQSIRVLRTVPKTRVIGAHQEITKRPRFKKMMITLSEKSKALDLAQFKA